MTKKTILILIFFLTLVFNFYFGFFRIESFSATDEHLWTHGRISQFWKAIEEKKWKKTNINDKPGITIAILSGIGLFSQGAQKEEAFLNGPKSPVELTEMKRMNFLFRFPIYLFSFLMAPVFFFLIKKLFNTAIAIFSIIFIYLSPILLGISLFVNPDSLLWLFLPLSLLSFLVFQKNQESKYAYLCGIFLGLSLLTKYVSTILYIFFVFSIFAHYIFSKEIETNYFKKMLSGYLKIILSSSLLIILLYPAIWAKPQIFLETTFFSRPFEKNWPFFILFIILFSLETFLLKNKFSFLVLNFLSKHKKIISKLILGLFLISVFFIFLNTYSNIQIFDFQSLLNNPKLQTDINKLSINNIIGNVLAGIYVLSFSLIPFAFLSFLFFILKNLFVQKNETDLTRPAIIIFSFTLIYYLASALNETASIVRYQISIYPLVSIISAIGFYQFINITKIQKKYSVLLPALLLLFFSTASLLSIKPFYFSYASNLLPKKYNINTRSMGDGGFEISNYLNNLPDAENITIWTDSAPICELFAGTCKKGINADFDNNLFDYFVVSSNSAQKSIYLASVRDMDPRIIKDLTNYYSPDEPYEYKIEIDKRPDNFMKLVKNTTPKITSVPFAMPDIATTSFPDRTCDITQYGASQDDDFLNTQAFSNAILDCSQQGGGKVNVPAGNWVTGPIYLKSNINLHVEKGAKIKFIPELKYYLPEVFSRFEGVEYYNYSSPIYAFNESNIAITGEGEINGQSDKWKKDSLLRQFSINTLDELVEKNIPTEKRRFGQEEFLIQPSFVQFVNCNKILLEEITIKSSPNWTIHPIYSENIIIKNVTIDSDMQNTDGIAIDSSKNILIENSTIDSGDDAIAIKSGRDKDGLKINKPSENIIIRNSKINSGHSGIAMGSEMSGGIKNVFAYNLNIRSVDYGIRFKSTPNRGGVVEKIWIKNINIDRAKSDAILIDLAYRKEKGSNNFPIFKDIEIDNLYCRRAKNSITLIGLPESPLRNIRLNEIEISATNDISLSNIEDEIFTNIKILK